MSGRFITVLVEEHDAVPDGFCARFHAVGEQRPVTILRCAPEGGTPGLWRVEALDEDEQSGEAQAVPVDDSGAGVTLLVYGGEYGLRLTPVDGGAPVRVPYLMLDTDAVAG